MLMTQLLPSICLMQDKEEERSVGVSCLLRIKSEATFQWNASLHPADQFLISSRRRLPWGRYLVVEMVTVHAVRLSDVMWLKKESKDNLKKLIKYEAVMRPTPNQGPKITGVYCIWKYYL